MGFSINGIIIKPTLMKVEISVSLSHSVLDNNKTKSRSYKKVYTVYGLQ